ncbi:hypothetical protein GF361_01320 [Candidatus Woesearchaeota archaeon]|nr:hypothetical protein [Candidatus Woesearchaeota archaeon]
MKNFKSIVRDIKEIKIQGAQSVAKAAAQGIISVAEDSKRFSRKILLMELEKSRKVLIGSRPTEPAMRNVLSFLFYELDKHEDILSELNKRSKYIKKHFEESEKNISKIGAKKISKESVVFTHCHSSTVVNILKEAKKKDKKKFEVYNTETRPLFQGRLTAKALSRVDIPVVHFVDSGGRIALKEADIMLIGADAISSEGKVINKIGSEMFAEIADKYDVPVYVCSDSWKFDPKSVFGYEEEIERRSSKEIWAAPPEGVNISNLAFEKVSSDLITGVISELGVYKPEIFVEEVKKAYPWMF